MRKKINIIFIIVAYLLNIAHYVQNHEHNGDVLSGIAIQHFFTHLHDGVSNCDLTEHEGQELPFNHCHLQHAHDNILVRNSQTSIQFSDLSEAYYSIYCLQLPEYSFNELYQRNDGNNFQVFIGNSLCLRAPPTLS
jgi:hypothetical protein